MRRALVDGCVQRGGVRHQIDACVQTRVTRAVAGTYGTFWLLRGPRASAQEKAGPIREGVDRGRGLGTIREQRGRGNVTETTDCEAYVVVDNWQEGKLGQGSARSYKWGVYYTCGLQCSAWHALEQSRG